MCVCVCVHTQYTHSAPRREERGLWLLGIGLTILYVRGEGCFYWVLRVRARARVCIYCGGSEAKNDQRATCFLRLFFFYDTRYLFPAAAASRPPGSFLVFTSTNVIFFFSIRCIHTLLPSTHDCYTEGKNTSNIYTHVPFKYLVFEHAAEISIIYIFIYL